MLYEVDKVGNSEQHKVVDINKELNKKEDMHMVKAQQVDKPIHFV